VKSITLRRLSVLVRIQEQPRAEEPTAQTERAHVFDPAAPSRGRDRCHGLERGYAYFVLLFGCFPTKRWMNLGHRKEIEISRALCSQVAQSNSSPYLRATFANSRALVHPTSCRSFFAFGGRFSWIDMR
jgi:hypothetical protein